MWAAPFVEYINDFLIFDRWGNVLFERNNLDPKSETITWQGIENDVELASGVYMMVVKYELESGQTFSLRQNITLLK